MRQDKAVAPVGIIRYQEKLTSLIVSVLAIWGSNDHNEIDGKWETQ